MPPPISLLTAPIRWGASKVAPALDLGEQAARFLGRNTVPAANFVGKQTVNLAKTEPGRAFGGAGIGAAAGNVAGDQLGLDKNVTTTTGAMAGMSASSPWVRNQIRYAARTGEDAPRMGLIGPKINNKPMAAAYNLLANPRYPVIEPALTKKFPLIAPKLFGTARAAPGVVGAGGFGFAAHQGLTYLPNAVTNRAKDKLNVNDPKALDDLWWRTFKKQPEIAWRTFAPGWAGGDKTPVGQLHKDLFWNVSKPDVQYGLTRVRNAFPTLMNTADTVRSAVPLGAMQTYAMRKYAPKEEPDFPELIADTIDKNRSGLANDPSVIKSPLARSYADILADSDLTKQPAVAATLATRALGPVTDKEQELRTQAGVPFTGRRNMRPVVVSKTEPTSMEYLQRKQQTDPLGGFVGHKVNWLSDDPRFAGPGFKYTPGQYDLAKDRLPIGEAAMRGLHWLNAPDNLRRSIGPNADSPWQPHVDAAVNSQAGRETRDNVLRDLSDNIRNQ